MLIKRQEYFFIPLVLILGAMVIAQYIPMVVAILVAILAAVLSFYQFFLQANHRVGIYAFWLVAIVLGISVGLYRPSGFSYPLIFSVNQLYDGGSPMSLYLNVGKLLAGYIIIYYLVSSAPSAPICIRSGYKQFVLVFVLVMAILSLAYELLGLQVHTKPLKYIVMFALVNLLATCVAEEAFMRLLLQEQIQKFIVGKVQQRFWQELIPLCITTLIFVLTHFVHGSNLIIVFAVAGFCYGLVYCFTKNIWACIATHFGVNILHFAFFTYPLAKAF